MGRQDGYYWVRAEGSGRIDGKWTILESSDNRWFFPGDECYFPHAILEIDERRLVRPDEVK